VLADDLLSQVEEKVNGIGTFPLQAIFSATKTRWKASGISLTFQIRMDVCEPVNKGRGWPRI